MIRFNLQPNLQGELVDLRPLKAGDFEALYLAASDPLIWEQHPQPTRYQRETFQTFFDGAIKSQGALVAIDRKTGSVAGGSRFHNWDPIQRHVIVGYTFLSRRYWGGGYNREMKKLMLTHAFKMADMVSFEIGEFNLRSRRAIEKIGAHFFEKQILDEKPYVTYQLTREAFEKNFDLKVSRDSIQTS